MKETRIVRYICSKQGVNVNMNGRKYFYVVVTLSLTVITVTKLSSIMPRIQINYTQMTSSAASDVTGDAVSVGGRQFLFPADLMLRTPWKNALTWRGKQSNETLQKINYYNNVYKQQVECRHRARVGDVVDGGWDVCLVGPYKPGPDCLVYNFGVAYVWSFDEGMVNTFGCTVRAFDPTMKKPEHMRGDKIHFYPVGLAGKDSDTEYRIGPVRTLNTLLHQFGDQNRIIDYLKVDVEFSEWEAFKTILEDGFLPKQVKQIGLEVHSNKNSGSPHYKRYEKVLQGLEEQGFLQWHHHPNPTCIYNVTETLHVSFCSEIYLININFLTEIKEAR